jgi:hypothetical protein
VECDAALNADLAAAGYGEVLNITAQLMDQPARHEDLVIPDDVIAHMKHSAARICSNSRTIAAATLHLTPECMPIRDATFYVDTTHSGPHSRHAMASPMGASALPRHAFHVLRGYLDFDAMPLSKVMKHINAQRFMLKLK